MRGLKGQKIFKKMYQALLEFQDWCVFVCVCERECVCGRGGGGGA